MGHLLPLVTWTWRHWFLQLAPSLTMWLAVDCWASCWEKSFALSGLAFHMWLWRRDGTWHLRVPLSCFAGTEEAFHCTVCWHGFLFFFFNSNWKVFQVRSRQHSFVFCSFPYINLGESSWLDSEQCGFICIFLKILKTLNLNSYYHLILNILILIYLWIFVFLQSF